MIDAKTPVSEFMTKDPMRIDAGLNLEDARDRMAASAVRHLPVTRDQRLVGIVSARDLMTLEALPGVRAADVYVENAMSSDPLTCSPETPVGEVVAMMQEGHVGAIPVTDGARLVGIFTTVDALTMLRRALV